MIHKGGLQKKLHAGVIFVASSFASYFNFYFQKSLKNSINSSIKIVDNCLKDGFLSSYRKQYFLISFALVRIQNKY